MITDKKFSDLDNMGCQWQPIFFVRKYAFALSTYFCHIIKDGVKQENIIKSILLEGILPRYPFTPSYEEVVEKKGVQ